MINESIELYDSQGSSIPFGRIQNGISFPKDTMKSKEFLIVQYRFYQDILPDTLGRSFTSGIKDKVSYIALDIPTNSDNQALIPKGLNYSGSFGRGLTAGNSQSLVLNSTFNMQLGGKIGDGIDLRAVISDANIPIQAEGTTQQLQEFDQVFIELTKDQQKLIAGDYRLERPDGYFINYSKKLKGLKYQNERVFSNKKGAFSASGSFAISGGKFSRNIMATNEGNQGPYKLQGSDNEQFIIVQSGSEKVYIDGQLLVRGENNDYIILYDRAEIIFMEKRPITKDVRVIVEFEYLVQNFARTISTANARWTMEKHDIKLKVYNESDNKNSSGSFELSDEDRKFLSQAGDQQEDNLISGIFRNNDFDINGIFYAVDFSTEGDTILRYSIDRNEAQYQSNFTDLGAENGSYEIDEAVNTNGRVYKYVGKGNGRYEAVRRLIAPESKQMYSISDLFKYHKNGQFKVEGSLSNFDKNLFSSNDEDDNLSFAIRADLQHTISLIKGNTSKHKNNSITGRLYGEYLHQDFNFLNPFRNQEFVRDWNLPITIEKGEERIGGGNIQYAFNSDSIKLSSNTLFVDFKSYQREDQYLGTKQTIRNELQYGLTSLNLQSSFLQTKSDQFNSDFIRPNGKLDRKWQRFGEFHTGIEYDGEYNNKIDVVSDTLLGESNEYDVLKFYANTDPEKKIKASIYYSKRLDRIADNNRQKELSRADNYGTSFSWVGKKQSFNLNMNYRVLETNKSLDREIEDAANLLGGIDYQYSFFDGLIRGLTNLNFNSGQEPKLEFDYREVALGEGNFIWIDNGDGIQEKNEFQISPFQDQANFIQIRLFNNEFIQVYKQDYAQTLRFNPVKWKVSPKKWKKRIAPLSSQTSLKLSRKDMQISGLPSFNFTNVDPLDQSLVSFISSINHSFFWNRGNPKYDIQYNYLENKTSILLTTGNEARDNRQYSLRIRKNILKKGDIELTGTRKFRGVNNLNFTANNYLVQGYEIQLNGTYRVIKNLEFRANIIIDNKKNDLGIEDAQSRNITGGFTYANSKRTRIDFAATYNRINYTNGSNPAIELAILEGLRDGNNFLWEIRFTKRLINNFDLTLNYNGRKTAETNTVHVANAQIRATF